MDEYKDMARMVLYECALDSRSFASETEWIDMCEIERIKIYKIVHEQEIDVVHHSPEEQIDRLKNLGEVISLGRIKQRNPAWELAQAEIGMEFLGRIVRVFNKFNAYRWN